MRPVSTVSLCRALAGSYLAVLLLLPPSLAAAAGPNLLVMGEDADPDSIPRGNSVFQRVQDSIASELHEAGYDVYDETAVTLGEVAAGRIGRDDADLIEAARGASQPPVDAVAIFSVYATAVDTGYITRLGARVSGRILQVQSGQRLGSFEVSTQKGWRIDPACAADRACLLEAVGDKARIIGREVAVALTAKLDQIYPASAPAVTDSGIAAPAADCLPSAYDLTFDGFDDRDIMDFEEYLTVFAGYREHRPVSAGVKHHRYWYRACITPARLKRNLTRMLEHLSLKALVRQAGQAFELRKLSVRGQVRN